MKRFGFRLLLIGVCAYCLTLGAAAAEEINALLILRQKGGVCTVSVVADEAIGSVQFALAEEYADSAQILTDGYRKEGQYDRTFAYIGFLTDNHTFTAAGTATGIPADTETVLLSFWTAETVDASVLSGAEVGGLDGDVRYACEVVTAAPLEGNGGGSDYASIRAALTNTRSLAAEENRKAAEEETGEVEEGLAVLSGETDRVPTVEEAILELFIDVGEDNPYLEDIAYVWSEEWMIGVSDVAFAPKAALSRAMLVTILYRLEGEPALENDDSFLDVQPGSWYEAAVAWANGAEIVLGYGDGRFGPDDPVTREQMAAIFYRYAAYREYKTAIDSNTNFLSYDDVFTIAEYAKTPMFWALDNDLIEDKDGWLYPADDAVREEVAKFLHGFCVGIAR